MKFSNMDIPAKYALSAPSDKIQYTTSGKLPCRDPFIMPCGDKYYLYKTNGVDKIVCHVSNDLENWSEAVTVFQAPEGFHGIKDMFWAPECHYYKGNFYIFTSVFSNITNHRSISVYRADNPLGPFVDIANGCINPRDWDAIDGTLFIDDNGDPWMIFVHEWTSMPDKNGSMVAARLSEDFTHLISEPKHLFFAKDPKWATHGVTDGPYPYRTDIGHLLMIWSNFCKDGYSIGIVHSESDTLDGPWVQEDEPFYRKGTISGIDFDGGHAMIFKAHDGALKLSFHAPNNKTENDFEHLVLMDIEDAGDTIKFK